jgi:hypothetical protein
MLQKSVLDEPEHGVQFSIKLAKEACTLGPNHRLVDKIFCFVDE